MATTEMNAEMVCASLRSWHEPLRQLQLDTPSPPSRCLSLSNGYYTETEPRLSAASFEGIHLLALLANVDVRLWTRVLKEIWTSDRVCQWIDTDTNSLLVQDFNAQPYTVALDWEIEHAEELTALADYVAVAVGPTPGDQRSTAFKRAVEQIAAMDTIDTNDSLFVATDATRSRASQMRGISISLSTACDCRESEELSRILQGIVQLATALQDTRDVSVLPFKIVQVYNVGSTGVPLAMDGLASLAQLCDLGIKIDSLPELADDCDGDNNVCALTRALRTVLLPLAADATIEVGIDHLKVTDDCPPPLVEAVLSAVQHNQSIRSLTLEMCMAIDRTELAQWMEQDAIWQAIARSLFSRHARHRIRHLQLSLECFEHQDLVSVEDALAEDGATEATNISRDPDGTHVTASRFHLHDPSAPFIARLRANREQPNHTTTTASSSTAGTATASTGIVYESATPLVVRVLEHFFLPDDREWRRVQLPGRGVAAWVAEQDVVGVTVVADDSAAFPSPRFEEVTIETLSDESMDSVASLLEIIGCHTQTLTVNYNTGQDAMDQWATRVLSACPELQDLAFSRAEFDSLELFVDCARDEYCSRLRRLALGSVHNFEPAHIRTFFQALCDPQHPLTVSLQELSLQFRIVQSDIDTIVQSATAMLAKNRSLRKISLGFHIDEELQSLKQPIIAAFDRYLRETVGIQTDRLALHQKIAFLSVVEHGRVREIDSSVVSVIFQFAAPAVTRQLEVHVG